MAAISSLTKKVDNHMQKCLSSHHGKSSDVDCL